MALTSEGLDESMVLASAANHAWMHEEAGERAVHKHGETDDVEVQQ